MKATPGSQLPGSIMAGICLRKEEGWFVQQRVGEAVGRANPAEPSDSSGTLSLALGLCGSEQWCDAGAGGPSTAWKAGVGSPP